MPARSPALRLASPTLLRALMDRWGYSLADLAAVAGTHRSAISRLTSGRSAAMREDRAVAVAAALHVDVAVLFDQRGERPSAPAEPPTEPVTRPAEDLCLLGLIVARARELELVLGVVAGELGVPNGHKLTPADVAKKALGQVDTLEAGRSAGDLLARLCGELRGWLNAVSVAYDRRSRIVHWYPVLIMRGGEFHPVRVDGRRKAGPEPVSDPAEYRDLASELARLIEYGDRVAALLQGLRLSRVAGQGVGVPGR